jgi:hypothetical protein
MADEAATAKDAQFVLVSILPDVCLTPDEDGILILELRTRRSAD